MAKLTAKQEKFIEGVVSGLSQSEAYRQAYNAGNMKTNTIADKACKLARRDDIRPIIEKRKRELADKTIWGREEALRALKAIALEAMTNTIAPDEYCSGVASAAIKAIEQANRMCGYNEPERVEHSGGLAVLLPEEANRYAD